MILPADHDRWIMFGQEVLVDACPSRDEDGNYSALWLHGRYIRPAFAGDLIWILCEDGSTRVIDRTCVHLLFGPRRWIPIEDLDAPPESDDVEIVAKKIRQRKSNARRARRRT